MRQRFLRCAKTVHARVELQMHGQNPLPFPRSSFEQLDVPWFPDGGSEILGDDPILLALPDSGHQQDAGLGAGAAQSQALRGIGYSQPLRALGFERERALHRAVAVTIDVDRRTTGDAFTDVLLHGGKIFSQRCQRNFRPSPAVENQRAAVGYFRQIGTPRVHVADYSDRASRLTAYVDL